jgi:hypothetical protein
MRAIIPKDLIDVYACYTAFLRIGFTAEEVSVKFDQIPPNPLKEVFIQLQSQGKTFFLPTGIKDNVLSSWNRTAAAIANLGEVKLDRYWEKSKFGQDPDQVIFLMQSLHKRGFRMPGICS